MRWLVKILSRGGSRSDSGGGRPQARTATERSLSCPRSPGSAVQPVPSGRRARSRILGRPLSCGGQDQEVVVTVDRPERAQTSAVTVRPAPDEPTGPLLRDDFSAALSVGVEGARWRLRPVRGQRPRVREERHRSRADLRAARALGAATHHLVRRGVPGAPGGRACGWWAGAGADRAAACLIHRAAALPATARRVPGGPSTPRDPPCTAGQPVTSATLPRT